MIDIMQADVLEWLLGLPDEHATAVLCDPPYGLSFMGKQWDRGVPSSDVWREALRVCKPSAVLMAFGGTRTWHRLAVAIEDAGWEIADTIMWVYGSGFPKSHDISKAIDREADAARTKTTPRGPIGTNKTRVAQGYRPNEVAQSWNDDGPATPLAVTWDGYGTALKPAWEPVIVARKPRRGTYAQTAVEHGTGALWVDGCRVGTSGERVTAGHADSLRRGTYRDHEGWNRPWKQGDEGRELHAQRREEALERTNTMGRWPANFALVHDERCNGTCIEGCPVAVLGEQSGELSSGYRRQGIPYNHNNCVTMGGASGAGTRDYFSSTGTAARFFYAAKASRGEREAGLEELGGITQGQRYGSIQDFRPHTEPDHKYSRAPLRNHHPAVKPLAVCEYLARLIVPPVAYRDDAVLLVPYAGSGSECIGAWQAGWRNIEGCELEAEYVEIARLRIAHWCRQAVLL